MFGQNSFGVETLERISSVRIIMESGDSRNVLVFLLGYKYLRASIAGDYCMGSPRGGFLPKPITYVAKYRK